MLFRDPVLHLFIQTDLSIGEMEEKLNERLTFSVDSNSSEVGRQIYRTMPRSNPNTAAPSLASAHNADSNTTSGVPQTNAAPNPAPTFVRSYSLASSGSDSAGT